MLVSHMIRFIKEARYYKILELRSDEIVISSALVEQLLMTAALDDHTVVDHSNHVGVDDRGQSVRDENRRAALSRFVQGVLYDL